MKDLRIIIITGTSGGGKTTALRAVEDLGFYCVDNLPLPLLEGFVDAMKAEPSVNRAALVVDARVRSYIEDYALALLALTSSGQQVELVFLDASDELLLRRFSQTRRRHPLGGDDLCGGLLQERALLAPLRTQASICIDTSHLSVHQLKALIQDRYRLVGPDLVVSFLSFGFRHGLPSYADLVLDVRFMPNPYFVETLRDKTGREPEVADYVLQTSEAVGFLQHCEALLEFVVPHYEREGKVYLTVAIGCTGGHHRSVAIAEELARRLGRTRAVTVRHRDVER